MKTTFNKTTKEKYKNYPTTVKFLHDHCKHESNLEWLSLNYYNSTALTAYNEDCVCIFIYIYIHNLHYSVVWQIAHSNTTFLESIVLWYFSKIIPKAIIGKYHTKKKLHDSSLFSVYIILENYYQLKITFILPFWGPRFFHAILLCILVLTPSQCNNTYSVSHV